MTRIALALATLMALAAGPAAAQSPSCPDIWIVDTSTSTERVPRMGPGSDLLTQHARFQNRGTREVSLSIAILHRAAQQNFVAGQVFRMPAGSMQDIVLANVVKPGIALAELRASIRTSCQ